MGSVTRSQIFILLTIIVVSPSWANPETDEQPLEKPAEVTDFEQCAVMVFQSSDKVSDVYKECETEMNTFVQTYDPALHDEVEQKLKVETQKALISKKIESK